MTKIGFIGLGSMGQPLALNLAKAGYALVVSDAHSDAAGPLMEIGARWETTPAELAAECWAVFLSLPGPPEIRAVALEGQHSLVEGLKKGSIVVDLSTNSPTVARELYAAYRDRGLAFLDAPISGGARGAATGKLAIWVGGDREAFDATKPLLDAMADNVRYIGATGAGTIAKLAHNAAGFATLAVLAEVFSVGVKAGVPPLDLWESVRQGAMGRMRTFDMIAGAFLTGNYDQPSFTLQLAAKDMKLARDLAEHVGVSAPMADHVLARMDAALSRGWGPADFQSFMKIQLEAADVEIAEERQAIREILKSG